MITPAKRARQKSGKGVRYGNLFPSTANVERKQTCCKWKKTLHRLMWSLQVKTTTLVETLMKFSVLRSCAPIHHMIMTIPWPWPPYHHHHHDFNHLYPPKLQNRRNIFRTSTETIYHPIFTLTLAITKGHHNGVTGRRQGIRQAGGGQPLKSMMEMVFGWQKLFED